jgi:hypothetical protein
MPTASIQPEWVQAFAAVVVALITLGILIATARYVKWTKGMVDEMKKGNDLQRELNIATIASLAVAQGQSEPVLVGQIGSRKADAETVSATVLVSNVGGGIAHAIEVITDWGAVDLPHPLAPGSDPTRVRVTKPRGEWDKHLNEGNPKILGFRFTDSRGERHKRITDR